MTTKALSSIRTFPQTRGEQDQFAEQILDFALSGEVNPIEIESLLRSMENILKIVRYNKSYKEYLSTHIDKEDGKTFKFKGVTITKGGRSSFDYSGYEKWKKLKTEIKILEDFYKSIPEGGTADPESGELLYSPPKKYTEYFTFKFDDGHPG